MASYQDDLAFLGEATPDLQQYILSDDVFWPLRRTAAASGGRQTPQLSIGFLAFAQRRLSEASEGEQADLAKLEAQIAEVREAWRANWARKAAQEYGARINLWQQYLRELRGEPSQQSAYYAAEVRQRTILTLLEAEMFDDSLPAHQVEQRNMLDSILRGLTQAGPFVWDEALSSAFPRDPFWFLYVTIRN
jgi:hypothetical protein